MPNFRLQTDRMYEVRANGQTFDCDHFFKRRKGMFSEQNNHQITLVLVLVIAETIKAHFCI